MCVIVKSRKSSCQFLFLFLFPADKYTYTLVIMGKRSRSRKVVSAVSANTEDAMNDDDAGGTIADQGRDIEEEEMDERAKEEDEEDEDEDEGDEEEDVIREARRLRAKEKDGAAEEDGKNFKNREKVLIVSARGITARLDEAIH